MNEISSSVLLDIQLTLSILLARAFNVVSLQEGSGAGVEVTCDGASQIVVQRSFVCAFESALGRVEQRESEFVEANAVCSFFRNRQYDCPP